MYDDTLAELHDLRELVTRMGHIITEQAAALAELKAELEKQTSRITSLTYWSN